MVFKIRNRRTNFNSGGLTAGVLGRNKYLYDVIGDTVNIASRMQTTGKVNTIQICNTMVDALKDNPQFVLEKRGLINIKGTK